ncbi:MAG TPA: dienelactone hydrolase family protein, partial [Pyrinomonadaceae bacterium]|nr:dienelactone hydrolase family protein [Pyrinomonadaceae bacterium]
MGEMVQFPFAGGNTGGYLATPEQGSGPGVIVIQEWWGLVDHIKDVCDRFADKGFVALAPDLYHGKSTKSPDEAGKLMMAMRIDEAERDLSAAVEYLTTQDSTTSDKIG